MLVLTVFLKVCDVLSERTSEPLLVFDEVSESFSIHCNAANYLTAKDALRKAGMKFPTPTTTRVVRGAEHLKGLV